MRAEGLIALPEDMGVRRADATRSLLAAVPVTRPWLGGPAGSTVPGDPPSPARPPAGCRFHTRCPRARDLCSHSEPPLMETDGRLAACWFPGADLAGPPSAPEEKSRT